MMEEAPEGAVNPPAPPPGVVRTTGPVLIDGSTGTVRNAENGVEIARLAPEPIHEREVDLALIAMILWPAAVALVLLGVWWPSDLLPVPVSASQKFLLSALAVIVLAERILGEIRRNQRFTPTEPEGVAHVAQVFTTDDTYQAPGPDGRTG